jgi:hypothetical protein
MERRERPMSPREGEAEIGVEGGWILKQTCKARVKVREAD